MEGHQRGVVVGGLIVAAALLLFVDPYLGGIAVVLVLSLGIVLFIMEETRNLPQVVCRLSEDAREITLVNEGNDRALRIHVTLVPLDREFDLPELPPDGKYGFPLHGMIAEAKALVSYENMAGRKFSRSFQLSATGKGDEDLLKPLFPFFGWK